MLKQLISEGKVQESTKSLASRLQKGGKSSASSKAAALSSIVPVSDNSLLRYKTMQTNLKRLLHILVWGKEIGAGMYS